MKFGDMLRGEGIWRNFTAMVIVPRSGPGWKGPHAGVDLLIVRADDLTGFKPGYILHFMDPRRWTRL